MQWGGLQGVGQFYVTKKNDNKYRYKQNWKNYNLKKKWKNWNKTRLFAHLFCLYHGVFVCGRFADISFEKKFLYQCKIVRIQKSN